MNASLLGALAIGVGFGFFLERGGLGNARKLAAQFYFTDMTVLKVLFAAIVTAMLGLFWLDALGMVDAASVYVPETFVVPQTIGGLIFGVGFVMSGLCPGTSCVSASTGRLDGLAAMSGMFLGIVAFNEAWPLLRGFYDSTPAGQVTLADLIGLPPGTTVLLVVTAAVGSFALATRIERRTAAA